MFLAVNDPSNTCKTRTVPVSASLSDQITALLREQQSLPVVEQRFTIVAEQVEHVTQTTTPLSLHLAVLQLFSQHQVVLQRGRVKDVGIWHLKNINLGNK